MIVPPKPIQEDERLATLKAYDVLDCYFANTYDDFTRLASQICGTPIALISLIDSDRQWFLSRQGIDAEETPRDISFCGHTILQDDIFEIENATLDQRTRGNPLVDGDPHIRFYAGCPLKAPNGHAIGTLCVIDAQPRKLSEEQRHALAALGRQVINQLELQSTIKELKEATTHHQKIAKEAKRLSLIAERTDNAVVLTDAKGRIEWVNQGFTRITEYTLDEIIGKKPGDFLQGPLTEPETIEIMRKAIQSGKPFKVEVYNYTKSGNGYWLSIHAQPLKDEAGNITNYMAVESDESERKEAEIKQAELMLELEQINKELSEFAYVVSHDLKAPLRAIHSLAGWLIQDYKDVIDEEGQEHLTLLGNRVNRMNDLINGVLEYSRTARLLEKKSETDLNELVNEVIDSLSPEKTNVVEITAPLPTLLCEPIRISQVFQNLISNALKYNDKSEPKIKISATEHADHWQFCVEDNGPGIKKKYHEKIFSLFQTLSAKDKFESTGIGLTIIKKIVEMNDGKVWIDSDEGAGCRFYFSLPKTQHRSNNSNHV